MKEPHLPTAFLRPIQRYSARAFETGRTMKKILILAAAALVATAGSAFAKGTTTISLDNFCDVLTIKGNKILKTALTMVEQSQDCEGLYGAGFVGKVKTFGNVVSIGLRGGSIPDAEYVMEISYPFVTGSSFILYGTEDGVNLTAFAGGTYTVN